LSDGNCGNELFVDRGFFKLVVRLVVTRAQINMVLSVLTAYEGNKRIRLKLLPYFNGAKYFMLEMPLKVNIP